MKIMLMAILSIGIVSGMIIPSYAQSGVTIDTVMGSGAPGCEIGSGCYTPVFATVDVGDVVIMSNTDTAAHTYTSGHPDDGPDGIFDTSLLMAGSSVKWIPEKAGTYPYFCMVHPWMVGTIVVGGDQAVSQGLADTPQNNNSLQNDRELEIENQRLKDEVRDLKLENQRLKNEIAGLKDQIVKMSDEFVTMIQQLNEWFRSQLG